MRFRLGINYWPVASAMYWWPRFAAAEAERDFARLRAAGFDSVRVFLLWEDFQPAPDRVSTEMLARLVAVADLAARHELALVPTLFTGHMSGVNWIPHWALDEGDAASRFRIVSGGRVVRGRLKNWFSDEAVRTAQARLAREVAATLKDHPALWAYDLGNENSNCVIPPTHESAIAWLDVMANAIKSVDARHPITIGLHMEDLEEDRRLGPREAARVCDFLCMHGYPIYADWARGSTDAMLLPFLGLITQWLGGREVLFEEFGAPTTPRQGLPASEVSRLKLLSEAEAASYTRRALDHLHRFGFTGAMLWCFGDYAESLWNAPPLDEARHERYFGLWRADHSEKPALDEIKEFTAVERQPAHADFRWIDLSADEFYANPRDNLRHLYQRFCEEFKEGYQL